MAAKNATKIRPWTKEDVRTLKTLAREKAKTTVIAGKLKRTLGATQKAKGLGVPGNPSISKPAGKPSDVSPAGMLSPGARYTGATNGFLCVTVMGYCRPWISKVAGRPSPSVGRSGAGIGIVG